MPAQAAKVILAYQAPGSVAFQEFQAYLCADGTLELGSVRDKFGLRFIELDGVLVPGDATHSPDTYAPGTRIQVSASIQLAAGGAGAGVGITSGAAGGEQLGAGAAAGGTSSLAGQFGWLQVAAPAAEVYVASFTITKGLYHAQLIHYSANDHGFGGTFYVQTLTCIKVTLVSLREDRLQRFVESEIMRPPPGAELEKAVIEPADITIRRSSDVSDMQLALNSAVDLSWQNVIVQAQYFREVQHDAPSGLGRGSDRKVGGSTRSRSSTREKEEEEGE